MLIRQFYAPNPFEPFGEMTVALNLIFGGVLNAPTFFMVGMIYDKGSFPVIGSILYLLIYFLNSYVLKGLMILYPNWILIILLALVYFAATIYVADKIRFER